MAESIQSRAQRMSGEVRRQQIVEVAADLFSKKGFSGTTTKEIADGAGVSEAIIFRRFSTKRDLYRAIIDFKTQQSSQDLQTELEEVPARKMIASSSGSSPPASWNCIAEIPRSCDCSCSPHSKATN